MIVPLWELEDKNGDTVAINPIHVSALRPTESGDETDIRLDSAIAWNDRDNVIRVKNSYTQIINEHESERNAIVTALNPNADHTHIYKIITSLGEIAKAIERVDGGGCLYSLLDGIKETLGKICQTREADKQQGGINGNNPID